MFISYITNIPIFPIFAGETPELGPSSASAQLVSQLVPVVTIEEESQRLRGAELATAFPDGLLGPRHV